MTAPARTPAWVAPFYDRKSELTGPSDVLPHHEERAEAIGLLTGKRGGRVLELGCGAGATAVATASRGFAVTAVELSPVRAGMARELARARAHARLDLTIVEGNLYTLPLPAPYDVVAMWDGFGMGTDDDQRALLQRAADWLAPDGAFVLDVFDPPGWIRVSGHDEVDEETGIRERVEYDARESRFVDSWWFDGVDQPPASQSVRCYGPRDLDLLVEPTPLRVDRVEHAGSDLDEAYSYRVVLTLA